MLEFLYNRVGMCVNISMCIKKVYTNKRKMRSFRLKNSLLSHIHSIECTHWTRDHTQTHWSDSIGRKIDWLVSRIVVIVVDVVAFYFCDVCDGFCHHPSRCRLVLSQFRVFARLEGLQLVGCLDGWMVGLSASCIKCSNNGQMSLAK